MAEKKSSWFHVTSGGRKITSKNKPLGLSQAYLRKVGEYLESVAVGNKLLIQMANVLNRNFHLAFKSQENAKGTPWKALALRTQIDRHKLGVGRSSPMLMRDSERLYDAVKNTIVEFKRTGTDKGHLVIKPIGFSGSEGRTAKGDNIIERMFERHNSIKSTPNPNKYATKRKSRIPGRQFYYLSDDISETFSQMLLHRKDGILGQATNAVRGKTHAGEWLRWGREAQQNKYL